jgi:hypothetical protein
VVEEGGGTERGSRGIMRETGWEETEREGTGRERQMSDGQREGAMSLGSHGPREPWAREPWA